MSLAVEALDFDPYRVWLNITESARPLNPYQLLAIVPLETDPLRIKAGYLRQQSALLMHADGADPQVWESINREIEDAYALLCDAEQKAVLDATIRRKTSGMNGKPPAGSAAAAAGATLTCRHCQRSNPASRRFCGGCGKPLWDVCPQCKAQCPADERFCGTCGADILGNLGEQTRQIQVRLDEAQELVAAHRYEAAISCLRGVAAISDPRFDKWAQQALNEIAGVESQRQAQHEAAAGALARARQALESCAFETAAAELAAVPQPLRTAEAEQLLEAALYARKELLTLGGEIRAALEANETANLLPKLDRLLQLKPDHKQALEIAQQLRDNLVRVAKRHLAGHRYREALDQLEQIVSFVRTPEVETLADTAGELVALLDGIKNAALADRPTLALADRLVKLAPANEEAAKIRAQLAERAKVRPADPRLGAVNFAPVPQRTLVGPPVDWLAQITHAVAGNITAEPPVDASLRERPGQFFVALGLALQGLGLASVPIDLMPGRRSGVLDLLQRDVLSGFSLTRRSSPAWGLDLSDFALKAVKLVQGSKPGQATIAACHYIPLERPHGPAGGDSNRPEAAENALQEFVSRAGELKGAKIVCGLPGQRVLGRFFELPPLAAKKVEDAISFEAKHQLPVDLEELCWASHTFQTVESKSADQYSRRVVVAAARSTHVADRLATFKAAEINVDQIQSDCLALHNALAHELFGSEQEPAISAAVCALDIGAEGTNVVISSPDAVWFRNTGLGGDTFTNQIVKQLALTHQQAEQVKREPARARRYGQLGEACRPLFVQLASEVERSLANYHKLFPDHPVQHIYGLGGGFPIHGLLRHLRTGR